MDTVILARHGESEFSAKSLVNGDARVPVGLTAAGRSQARRLGRDLAARPIDLCVVSDFVRARETADLALAGRDVPRVVMSELNDPRAGSFEGRALEDYRRWAHSHGPSDDPPGGGESRASVAKRLARGYAAIAARPEETILVVGHSLPIAYALNAAAGRNPTAKVDLLGYGEPHPLTRAELTRAVDVLEAWARDPRY